VEYKCGALLKFCTTSIFPVPTDIVHHHMVGFRKVSRVSRVTSVMVGIRVSVRIRVGFSFSGANL